MLDRRSMALRDTKKPTPSTGIRRGGWRIASYERSSRAPLPVYGLGFGRLAGLRSAYSERDD
jgi:hypothetical protein